jgi:hypothetical protein
MSCIRIDWIQIAGLPSACLAAGQEGGFWKSADQRSGAIAINKQNARREFPPGVEVQPAKFFSWLRPSVKTEKCNAPDRRTSAGNKGYRCSENTIELRIAQSA